MEVFPSHSTIKPSQHGFVPKRSDLLNLLAPGGWETTLMDDEKQVYMVYLDLAKAFESSLAVNRRDVASAHNLSHESKAS